MPRVLFILKFRDYDYDCGSTYGDGLSSGLFNSARLVVDMLLAAGVEAKLVQVRDNNDIDREVTGYRPSHVVIEGLWVVPEKFSVLIPLHPRVKWIVRIHSNIPFLAMEGVAMDWLARYSKIPHVSIACNSERATDDIRNYIREVDWAALTAAGIPTPMQHIDRHMRNEVVHYLPNYYPRRRRFWEPHSADMLKIGCFGAIRPLKNQLIQAMAAIEFATRQGKQLRFYMTHRDCEQGGDQVLKNLRALFAQTRHELVLRPWLPHEDFLGLVDVMDVGMQVSLSETFCIVAADMVAAGLPVVVSPEIEWASGLAKANPTDMLSIVDRLELVTRPLFRELVSHWNRLGLEDFSRRSREIWLKYLHRSSESVEKAA
jgi:hypothetical protein